MPELGIDDRTDRVARRERWIRFIFAAGLFAGLGAIALVAMYRAAH